MSAFGRVVALIGLILIGFGLFTPVLCPNTGCTIPDHSFIDTRNFEDDFTAGLLASQPALYLVTVSLVIFLAMVGGHRFAMLTAALMLLTIISMYLIQSVLSVTQDGANTHLGWGWSLLMVGGVLLLIATIPKSDQLLEQDGYDDYYDDRQPAFDPQQGAHWQQLPYQQQTMQGGWQQQQMPPLPQQPPQQPMLASGMVSGMYGTNPQPQPIQSPAMPVPQAPQAPQVPQRQRLPAQPPPDPLRQTEPDLLNRDRGDSRQLARTDMAPPARPSVPSPRASQQQAARPPIPDKEATNEFATPEPLRQTPNMIQQQPAPAMTSAISRPSPRSQSRAVDESSQALIRTLISEDSKTIIPAEIRQQDAGTLDATEPDRNIERDIPRSDPPPMPSAPPKSTSPIPAPSALASDEDDDEVDLMRVTGMIRAPKPTNEDDVDLIRASGSMKSPKPPVSPTKTPPDAAQDKATLAFGKGPPPIPSDDRAALLLNQMPDEDHISKNVADSAPIAMPDLPDEESTQSFGKPAPQPSADRADFLLTAAKEEDERDEHDTHNPLPVEALRFEAEDDIRTVTPPVAEDDSLPFGVPVLDDEYEQPAVEHRSSGPQPEIDDSQPYDVPILEDDVYDPEEDNDTDPELRDKFDQYAAALTNDNEDTGPYDVPMLEDDDDDEDDFQTIISPD